MTTAVGAPMLTTPLRGTAVAADTVATAGPSPVLFIVGLLLCAAALAAVYLAVFPPRRRISLTRNGPAAAPQQSKLTSVTAATTRAIERMLQQLRGAPALAAALEAAGLRMKPAEFIIVVASSTVVLSVLIVPVAGVLGILLVVLVAAFGARLVLGMLAGRRRTAFSDQLDDTLELMASGLRAGHSLPRAIDALSTEADAPTSEEFARITNETRLGRDLGQALDAAAARMRSEDFLWVAQAIAIHREVGGNLAEVLDQVGQTIRERNQIRRQVKALSAEGRISALVLMVLPFALGGILVLITPTYLNRLFADPLGWAMLAAAAVLLIVGGLWLRKVISFTF
ncbi:type II secretion system F family protein [Tersicoccus phoenicis]|uniref:type II secretion system F family protein n=1 Tax=Tersicoccus phoenicis TaxID=554083 RepID=UPI001F3BD7D7|nr:type II secretion system F family protein [Tersicoccus phoenicis]